MEIFIINEGCDVNQIGEGFQYPVYRGKNSSVLKFGCEVLKRKNTQILEREIYSTSSLLDSFFRNEHEPLISEKYG